MRRGGAGRDDLGANTRKSDILTFLMHGNNKRRLAGWLAGGWHDKEWGHPFFYTRTTDFLPGCLGRFSLQLRHVDINTSASKLFATINLSAAAATSMAISCRGTGKNAT